jgi:hypothetical protein
MTALFYGVYFDDPMLAGALDLIRFLMEPDAIRFSHITIRGPYNRRLPEVVIQDQLVPKVGKWEVALTEPGCFFENNQNTVYLGVDLRGLRTVWHKPSYPEGLPHVTLYDGPSRAQARTLITLLSHHWWGRPARVSSLRPIDEKSRLDGTLFELIGGFTSAYSSFLGSSTVTPQEVAKMPFERRFELVGKVIVRLGCPLIPYRKNRKAYAF